MTATALDRNGQLFPPRPPHPAQGTRGTVRPSWLARIVLAAAALGTVGCTDKFAPPKAGQGPEAVKPRQNHFDLALDLLSRLDGVEPQQGMIQIAYHLNRWIESTQAEPSWKPDPLLDKLPASLRGIEPLAAVGRREFTTSDVLYLREASWLQSISQWVAEQSTPLESGEWLQQLEQTRGEPHAHEVEVALRLFDWTVRNIQLDPLLDYPAGSSGPAAKEGAAPAAGGSPASRAEPGPGYQTWPWQTLMFGRGDAWQRARVFIGLARQQQIDVVLLAVDKAGGSPRPFPWLPAALIDDQLYLFDPQLGLPIAGPGERGVATLAQVRADESLLRQMDVGQEHRYPVSRADLDRLVVLIDACPEALSQRLQEIDAEPHPGQRLLLSVEPSKIAAPLKRCEGVSAVQLWTTPLETWVYRTALQERVNLGMQRRSPEDMALFRRLFLEEELFNGMYPLVLGRQQHFRGHFETRGQKEGAKGYYQQSRLPDTTIQRITTSPDVQNALGIVRQRENDQEWAARLEGEVKRLVRFKQNASYWLGLVQYEAANYESAVYWLNDRTLEASDGGPWTSGARYNLARTYERQGDLEHSRQLLLLDDSPQKHGNLLRARYLRQRIEAAGGEEGSAPPKKP